MNDFRSSGEMVAVKREPGTREAVLWFRCPWEGDSEERKSEVGLLSLSGVVYILSVNEMVGSGSEAVHKAAITMDVL